MKFKLFGRLRDEEGSTPTQNQGRSGQQPTEEPGFSGGSLERTVENMFQQGYSEEEIMDELQGQYSPTEISRAVNNAVTSTATQDSSSPQAMTPYSQDADDEAVSPMDEGYNKSSEQEPQPPQEEALNNPENGGFNQQMNQQEQVQPQQQIQEPQQEQQQMQQNLGTVDQATEELIETIVAEQFQRVSKEFEGVYEELDIIVEEVEDLEERVKELEIRDDEDQQQFVQKVDEMEDHIDAYQSRIGGLEKAFQQVLPSLVENVKDLTSLVQEIKSERGIETETQLESDDVGDIDMSDW